VKLFFSTIPFSCHQVTLCDGESVERISTSLQDGTHSRLQTTPTAQDLQSLIRSSLPEHNGYLVLLIYDCRSSLLGAIGGISPASQRENNSGICSLVEITSLTMEN